MRPPEDPATSQLSPSRPSYPAESRGERLTRLSPSDEGEASEGEENALPPSDSSPISPLVSSFLGASLPLLVEADGFLYNTVDEPCQRNSFGLTKLNNWTKHMKHKTKKPAHWDYTKRTSKEQAITGRVDRETKLSKLSSDLDALSAVQSARPLKPPTRKP